MVVRPSEGGSRPLAADILAGITLAALAIPEVMGYTKISGTPVITGLYTMLLPLVLFAAFGSSRHLVVGADSATAAMLAAGIGGLAVTGSPEYVALAGLLALMAAGFLLIARIFRLGFLANFLSRTVLIGFLTGVGVQVAVGQIPGMLGLKAEGGGPISRLVHCCAHWQEANVYAVGLSACVIVAILICKTVSQKFPGPLLTVVGATAAGWALGLESKGVRAIGAIPRGMPEFGLPQVAWDWPLLEKLMPLAFGMFVVILAQSMATSRAYAARYGESLSEDDDLLGLSLANIGAGLTGTFVVNGSPTKTQMVDSAGGRTQAAHLTAAAVVVVVLAFLTEPMAHMPEAVLAAVVFLMGLELVDIKGIKRIHDERRWEFWVAVTTAATVVSQGAGEGILLAIFLSLIVHTRHGYQPRNLVVVCPEPGKWQVLPVGKPGQAAPGLMIYRFNHSMYYANTSQLWQEVQTLLGEADPPLRWFCIDCVAVDDVDFSAAEVLHALYTLAEARDVKLVLCCLSDHVRKELELSGLTSRTGSEAHYDSVAEVLAAYGASVVL